MYLFAHDSTEHTVETAHVTFSDYLPLILAGILLTISAVALALYIKGNKK